MSDSRFLAELEKRVLLGSGAMGTELLRRGSLPDRPVDELNLTRPHMVLDLMREYASAGAEVIKTNTFLANRIRLKGAGLHDRVRDINLAGAQLARDAAKGRFVAGCVGPIGTSREGDPGPAYQEQCSALAEGGCDLLLLETFLDWYDLAAAIQAARSTGLPIVAQMANAGVPLHALAVAAQKPGVADVVGINCVGPADALKGVDRLSSMVKTTRSAFPNAGLPGSVMQTDEFAKTIKALVDAGVRLVGGCCGAGPDHIRAAAAVLGRGR
jgi:homocysteine S-methyltransferase